MNLLLFKLIISLLILLFGLLSVMAPLVLVDAGSDSAFSVGNMMASGVLLAAALTHQLADASSTLDRGEDGEDGYPWSMFIAGCTFIAFLIMEESIHLVLSGGQEHLCGDEGGWDLGGTDHSHGTTGKTEMVPGENSFRGSALSSPPVDGEGSACGHHGHGAAAEHRTLSINRRSCRGSVHMILPTPSRDPDSGGSDHHHHGGGGGCGGHKAPEFQPAHERQPLVCKSSSMGSSVVDIRASVLATFFESMERSLRPSDGPNHGGHHASIHNVHPHHHHEDHLIQHLHGSVIASLVLLLALCLHSILAGLSIGMVLSTSAIASTAAAILAHKIFAGYALGSSMAAAEMDRSRHVLLGAAFALSTPLGIYIGMGLDRLLQGSYNEDSTPVGIIHAVVAGTFLYVAIVEVGMKELLVCRHGEGGTSKVDATVKMTEVLKLVAFLGGFVGMSGLAAFI